MYICAVLEFVCLCLVLVWDFYEIFSGYHYPLRPKIRAQCCLHLRRAFRFCLSAVPWLAVPFLPKAPPTVTPFIFGSVIDVIAAFNAFTYFSTASLVLPSNIKSAHICYSIFLNR